MDQDRSWRWLYPFEIPLVVYTAVAVGCAARYGLKIGWWDLLNFRYDLMFIVQGTPVALLSFYLWQRVHLKRSFAEVKARLKQIIGSMLRWPRAMEVVRILLAVKLCLMVYSHLKQTSPSIHPALYDAQLERVDRAIHLGHSPVEMAMAAVPWRAGARAVDVLYAAWYLLKAPVLLVFLCHPEAVRRWRFFTAYVLLWMIGGGLAIAVPSLGPVYVMGQAFAGLHAPVAHQLQGMLWTHYQQYLADPTAYRIFQYEGIAAFPSLHVGVAVLFTLALRPWGKLFWAMAAYTLAVQFGSVYLGWHWAVDGYAATLLAGGIWWSVGRLIRPAGAGEQAAAEAEREAVGSRA